MTSTQYIGMDVHKESISIAVRNAAGKIVMECVIETKASTILQFFDGLRGDVQVTFEEGTWAAWLYDLLKPHVTRVVVCDPHRNALLQEATRMTALTPGSWPNCCTTTNCVRSITETTACDLEGTGAQLSDHHPRSQPSDDPGESPLSQLRHPFGLECYRLFSIVTLNRPFAVQLIPRLSVLPMAVRLSLG
jgi:hypothetical protein